MTATVAQPSVFAREDWLELWLGSAEAVLPLLADASVDCVVTSPPYYRLRDYEAEGQLGVEATPELYVERLADTFDLAVRVLAPTGTLWLNLGDTYDDGELLGVPWLVAFELKRRGWRLVSEVIWHKPDAQPESVERRPNRDHEQLFAFARQHAYFYASDRRRPPAKARPNPRLRSGTGRERYRPGGTMPSGSVAASPDGRRNLRTVWTIAAQGYRGPARVAPFPRRLASNCVALGCPPGGIVLDPYFGVGTTAIAARIDGKRCVGIELNPATCREAAERLGVIVD